MYTGKMVGSEGESQESVLLEVRDLGTMFLTIDDTDPKINIYDLTY